ncbi:MAG TPA: acyl-CoA dehydrogenase [Anaeromyxobacteraceae bacterium]|nr:acyl-CoA dehydrogenase [Anaeromyxobacteraceae bacterium]
MPNPLLDDRGLEFVLYDALGAADLASLPHFADHGRETFDAWIDLCRRFARDVLFPAYRPLDEEPPVLRDGAVRVHPRMREIWPRMCELGVIAASRPAAVGGQQLPATVALAANLYLMAGNCAAYAYAGLTSGAAHLVEAFGSPELRERWLGPLHEGRFAGTMALTEPQAGSSLADVRTRATPRGDHFLLSGSKIFISGGDQDVTANVVHMVLARIDGAPAGTKGVSLFLVPKLRPGESPGSFEPNDVGVAGLIHKIGWKGLPSVVLSLGESGDCRGWLLGEPGRGLAAMFQMMNEARIMVGANGVATASAAYLESLAYARERPQGRPLASRDPLSPQVPIVEHADVRRMLLRQKAIVEGGLALVLAAALQADRAEHDPDPDARHRSRLVLDLLTPVAKSFPAERGFESTALALQIHGGYGYSSEYLPEAWLRDQKLNSIHEGTTGIQGLDLLGRKAVAEGGAALAALAGEIEAACARAERAGVDPSWIAAVREAVAEVGALTADLAARGLAGDPEGMLVHSADYLDVVSTVVVAWLWLLQGAAAREALSAGRGQRDLLEGKLAAARYWIRSELPRIGPVVAACRAGEASWGAIRPDSF